MKLIFLLASLIVVLTLLSCLGLDLFVPVLYLLAGWLSFLGRVIPEVTVSWTGWATGITCLVLLAAGGHYISRWFWQSRTAESPQAPWKFRWTVTGLGLVILLFAAGVAAVGIAHQSFWLATSPKPIFRDRSGYGSRAETGNNLRQIGVAVHTFVGDDKGRGLPPGTLFSSDGQALHGWMTHLLPYVDAVPPREKISMTLSWNHPLNREHFQETIPSFLNPAIDVAKDANGFGLAHFAGNVHVLGPHKQLTMKDISDGSSNTILAGEVNSLFAPWGHPLNWRDPAVGLYKVPGGFGSVYQRGVTFVMADASTRTVSPSVSLESLKAASTPNSDDKLGSDF